MSPHEAELARQLGSHADVIHLLNSFTGHGRAPTVPAAPSAAAAETDVTRIVTVGGVAPQKDPDMFVQILAMLRASGDVQATWVGDGDGHTREDLELSGVTVTGWSASPASARCHFGS